MPALPSVPGWKDRFDRIILVTTPDDLKIQRFVGRSTTRSSRDPATLAQEARKRLAAQIPDAQKAALSDWVIDNSGDIEEIRATVADIYAQLKAGAAVRRAPNATSGNLIKYGLVRVL